MVETKILSLDRLDEFILVTFLELPFSISTMCLIWKWFQFICWIFVCLCCVDGSVIPDRRKLEKKNFACQHAFFWAIFNQSTIQMAWNRKNYSQKNLCYGIEYDVMLTLSSWFELNFISIHSQQNLNLSWFDILKGECTMSRQPY